LSDTEKKPGMPEETAPAPVAPPISVGTEYTRAFIMASIEVNGRKWGRKVVKEMAKVLASEETFAEPLRPVAGYAEALRIHRETMAVFQGHLPAYLVLLKV